MSKATWYFDFISPFAYLQLARFSELPKSLEVTLKPVLFGSLLKHWGQLGPAEIPSKRRFVYRFFQWNADRLGIPFVMPPSHPYNPLPSLRLCVAAGSQIHHVKTVFDLIYGQGIQPDSLEGIQATAKALGISDPVATINDSDVKTKLRENTELAIAEGVFGVPSFVVNREVFWGGDATDMLLNYLDNPNLFKTSEMTRISTMPMGVKRKIVS
jgi:2-hydroxychromene-2-carboxylate isomerase